MLNSWKNENDKSDKTPVSRSPANQNVEISVPKMEDRKPVGNSTIDACLTMRGDLESDADILVKGKVFGNVTCNLLIVDVGANIKGGIIAKDVVIRGKVEGVIRGEKVRLDKTAEVESDIYQDTFIAEEGAKILGTLKSLKDAPKDISKPVVSKADVKAA